MGARAWPIAALLSALLVPAPAAAQADGATPSAGGRRGWSTSADATLRVTATDNVLLSSGDKQGDVITQVTPGLHLRGRGPRFTADLSYTPSALLYADHHEANDVANTLRAFARLEALEKFFFVDLDGNISQSFLSPFEPQPGELTVISDNRTETRSLGVTPYVRGRLGSLASYELRNRNVWTTTSRTQFADSYSRQWTANVGGPLGRLGWSLEVDDTQLEYDDPLFTRPEQRQRLERARLSWQPDPGWRFSVSAGRERNNYAGGTEDRYSDIGGAGVLWSPGVRTSARFDYEKRFFGPSRLARFNHRTRLTAWQASYSKNTTSYEQEVLRLPAGNSAALLDAIFAARIPDPVERAAAVEQFLRSSGTPAFLGTPLSFFTQQVFLQERLEGSVGILGVRNSVTFTAFAADSESLSSGLGALLPELGVPAERVRTHGYAVSASHRVTPFTTLTATGGRSYARSGEPAGRETRNDNLSMTLTVQMAPRTNGFAGVSYTGFRDPPAQDRAAHSLYAGVSHQF